MAKNSDGRKSLFESPVFATRVKSANVKAPELLFGYFLAVRRAAGKRNIYKLFKQILDGRAVCKL